MKDTARGRTWFQRHPVLSVIALVWALIWGAAAFSSNDAIGISIAAWLVLVAPVALIAWGLGGLMDRRKQRHQASVPGGPAALSAAPPTLPSSSGEMTAADQLHQQRYELAIEQREFDRDLQRSEAGQWHRLMEQRHAAAIPRAVPPVRTVPLSGTAAPAPPRAVAQLMAKPDPTSGTEDEYCPSCGARFSPNDRFCPSCGHPRGTH